MVSSPKETVTVSNKTSTPPPPTDTNLMLLSELRRGNEQRAEQMRQDKNTTFIKVQ